MTDDLQPGTLVQWRDPYGGGRRVGTLVRIERHRDPKPGKVRKPDEAIIETGGAIARSDRHKVPASMVTPYARRYYPDGVTVEAPEACPECGERDACTIECPTRDDDPAAARDYIEQDDPGDGSPVLALPI